MNEELNLLAVADLQQRLRTIAEADGGLPQVSVDGIYSEETAAAVRAFQQRNGLPVTGMVDLPTWQAVGKAYDAALVSLAEPRGIRPTRASSEDIALGSRGDRVLFLQLLLDNISERFDNIPDVPRSGLYEEDTADAVRVIQRAAGINDSGVVDSATWNVIVDLFNLFFERAW